MTNYCAEYICCSVKYALRQIQKEMTVLQFLTEEPRSAEQLLMSPQFGLDRCRIQLSDLTHHFTQSELMWMVGSDRVSCSLEWM